MPNQNPFPTPKPGQIWASNLIGTQLMITCVSDEGGPNIPDKPCVGIFREYEDTIIFDSPSDSVFSIWYLQNYYTLIQD